MRKTNVEAPEISRISAPDLVLADLKLKVVTPMFGGGATSGKYEQEVFDRVRGSAIKSSLRFWWRACNAAAFETLEELHAAECRLWGAAADIDQPDHGDSAIRVRVRDIQEGQPFSPDATGLSYVLFPFQQQGNDASDPDFRPAEPGISEFAFRLTVCISPYVLNRKEECEVAVRQSLWAWIAFGGLGARTRRGCGSIYCLGDADPETAAALNARVFAPPANAASFQHWLTKWLNELPRGEEDATPLAGVPSLISSRIAFDARETRDHLVAWKHSVALLQRYIQPPRPRSKENPPAYRWPEDGAGRKIANVEHQEGSSDLWELPETENPDHQFLRSALGLPRPIMIFPGDETSTMTMEREEDGFSRMASPVIIKSVATSSQSSFPVLLILHAPQLWEVESSAIRLWWKLPGMEERQDHVFQPTPMYADDHGPFWPVPGKSPPEVEGKASIPDSFWDYSLSRGWSRIS